MYKRRVAREVVLQALYRLDIGGCSPAEAIEETIAARRAIEPGSKDYALRLFHRVVETLPELDRAIEKHSTHWTVERMSIIDRNILRIGACEILYIDDVPFRVAIDEAVELAKRYGTKESAAFINGILDSIAKDHSSFKKADPQQPLQGCRAIPAADNRG